MCFLLRVTVDFGCAQRSSVSDGIGASRDPTRCQASSPRTGSTDYKIYIVNNEGQAAEGKDTVQFACNLRITKLPRSKKNDTKIMYEMSLGL